MSLFWNATDIYLFIYLFSSFLPSLKWTSPYTLILVTPSVGLVKVWTATLPPLHTIARHFSPRASWVFLLTYSLPKLVISQLLMFSMAPVSSSPRWHFRKYQYIENCCLLLMKTWLLKAARV